MYDVKGKCGSNIWYPAYWVKLENGETAPKFSIPLKKDSVQLSYYRCSTAPFLFILISGDT